MTDERSGLPKEQRRRRHKCETCGGLGRVPGVRKVRGMGKGMGSEFGPCPDCDGLGWISREEADER